MSELEQLQKYAKELEAENAELKQRVRSWKGAAQGFWTRLFPSPVILNYGGFFEEERHKEKLRPLFEREFESRGLSLETQLPPDA